MSLKFISGFVRKKINLIHSSIISDGSRLDEAQAGLVQHQHTIVSRYHQQWILIVFPTLLLYYYCSSPCFLLTSGSIVVASEGILNVFIGLIIIILHILYN